MTTRVVIIGGGPGGYEAALVASQLGGEVTLVDTDGLGGSAVLTDCVPSKTLIATAEVMTGVAESTELGIRFGGKDALDAETAVHVDLAAVNKRVLELAARQSDDINRRLTDQGVRILLGRGRLEGKERVIAETADGDVALDADVILVATGAHPRVLPDSVPDGERILTWTQVYALNELPEKLIVVGSGVTGAEFASAYDALGAEVVLVSSRDRVLPGRYKPVLVTFWIDEEDRIREVEIIGPILSTETDDVVRVVTLSEFNEPVEIEAPGAVSTPGA